MAPALIPIDRRTLLKGSTIVATLAASGVSAASSSLASFEGYVTLPGGRLWVTDSGGAGPAVVFLHPATGNHASWIHQTPALTASGYRVIAWSRWGYARSGPPTNRDATAADDVIAILDHFGISRAHIVGVAAGGGIALNVIGNYARRVLSATVACSLLGLKDAGLSAMTARIRPDDFGQLPPAFRELSASYRAINPHGVAAWEAIVATRHTPETRPRAEPSFTPADIAATRVPLLLVAGDADLYMPPAIMRHIARLLPGSRFHVIDDAAHAVFWEQPTAFNTLLLKFLEESRHRSLRRRTGSSWPSPR